jgi:hypothetical protein
MAEQSDAKRAWHEVTLADSDEGSSSSDGSRVQMRIQEQRLRYLHISD